jgi:hypothetical protein
MVYIDQYYQAPPYIVALPQGTAVRSYGATLVFMRGGCGLLYMY